MGLTSPIWNSFNAGELSPLLDGRTDQDKYFSGCSRLENFLLSVQGPAMRRGGTRYVGEVKASADRTWLMTFEFSVAQSYVLELGPLYMRFWVSRGQLLSGGFPYEIVTPWAAGDLITSENTLALRSAHSGDVQWFANANGNKRPYKLSRVAATNWTLTAVAFDTGPFADVDPANTVNITASGVTGAVVLTAGSAIFRASDVGTSFYLEAQNPADLPTWKPTTAALVNDVVRYEGNVYVATVVGASGKTGIYPPVHLRGDAQDGITDVTWRYLHSGYGYGAITAIGGGGTTANMTVKSRLPAAVAAVGTTRWGRAAFNDDDGWPVDVKFFRDRLFYAKGHTLYGSVVGSYDDFSRYDGPDVTEETALILPLAADNLDAIRWISQAKALLVGGPRAEFAVGEQTTQKVFAADNAKNDPQTEYGSRLLAPLKVGNALMFVQRAGRTVREIKYDYSVDGFAAEDLNVLSEQVLDAGVIDWDFQQEPDNTVWFVLANGALAALTYNRPRGVIAWAPHYLGSPALTYDADLNATGFAVAESVAVIPKPDGRRDDVWLVARRTINGVSRRYVEYIEDQRLVETSTADGFFVDCGITYSGVPATTITGLGHLEGCVVQVLTDGGVHADRTVTAGQITLDAAASKVQIGFNSAARLRTMRADMPSQGGTSQGDMKSIASIVLRLKNTIGGEFGPSFDRLDYIPGLRPFDPVATAPRLFTGDTPDMTFPASYDTDAYICVAQRQPLPMTLVAIMPSLEVSEEE